MGATSLPQLIEEADQALYAAKQAGRNIVSTFTDTPWLVASSDEEQPYERAHDLADAAANVIDPGEPSELITGR